MADVKIDQATLEAQETELTEDQMDAIGDSIYKEEEKKPDPVDDKKPAEEEPGEDENKSKEGAPKEETVLTDEEILSTEDDKLSDVQKTKKAELTKVIEDGKVKIKEEEERLISAKDEDLNEEDKTKKAEIVKAREESKTKDTEAEIKAYATEHKVTEDEARTDLESIAKIQEKYKDDPKQLAKANLHLQRLYSKTEAEAKAQQEAAPVQEVTIEAVEKYLSDGKLVVNGQRKTKEDTIDAYRAAYPDLTEDLEDEKVFKLAAKEWKQHVDRETAKAKTQVSIKAQEKRSSMYDSIPEADKRFIPDVKPIIEKLSDAQIAHDKFDINTYVLYVKGHNYDADVKKSTDEMKAFGAKEYKRGLQEAKILGTKSAPTGKPPVKGTIPFTEAQKKEAEAMYDSPGITKEKAYELYADYMKGEKKGD